MSATNLLQKQKVLSRKKKGSLNRPKALKVAKLTRLCVIDYKSQPLYQIYLIRYILIKNIIND